MAGNLLRGVRTIAEQHDGRILITANQNLVPAVLAAFTLVLPLLATLAGAAPRALSGGLGLTCN
jgi:hypothetical protein